jgi:hypothetical protein
VRYKSAKAETIVRERITAERALPRIETRIEYSDEDLLIFLRVFGEPFPIYDICRTPGFYFLWLNGELVYIGLSTRYVSARARQHPFSIDERPYFTPCLSSATTGTHQQPRTAFVRIEKSGNGAYPEASSENST